MMTTRFIFYFIYLHLPHRINMTERKGKNIYIYILLLRLQIYRAGLQK